MKLNLRRLRIFTPFRKTQLFRAPHLTRGVTGIRPNLIDEIRTELTDRDARLSNTLRKAKILASNLRVPEFREWVDFELGGYPADRVPSYRVLRPQNLGYFAGPFGSSAKNVKLPTFDLPSPLKEFAERLEICESVGELEAWGRETVSRNWTPEMVMVARNHIAMSGDMVLIEAHQPVPAHVVLGILDQVKNKLLDFLLDLEEHDVSFEKSRNSSADRELARNLFHINVYGNSNFVSAGENVRQNSLAIKQGDLDSLIAYLERFGLAESDLQDLKGSINADPTNAPGEFGPRVRMWLGCMVAKAANNALDLGVSVASDVLTGALKSYYGL